MTRATVQIVKMKGRVACEISTCECLIASEAIFMGLFADLEPAEAAALLCALVNQHKLQPNPDDAPGDGTALLGDVPLTLKNAVANLCALTQSLGQLQERLATLGMTVEDYVAVSVRPSLTAVRRGLCWTGSETVLWLFWL
jgi:superfamily II RNA helicase